uniref:227 kDa spindle-and centromere-associated protein n=1 Tax=Ascaris suum TaxID=6253 RepID=F1KPS9_ASCSU
MESASTESGITRRVTRTVVTRTNYGASGGDATLLIGDVVSGDNTALDVSNSLSTDVILASGARGTTSTYSISALDHDLSSFKKRIDANTEEQREHADLMAELQHKVEEYRRRIADIEGQIAAHRSDEKVTFDIKESTEVWTPEVTLTSGDFTIAQLEEERRRNEEQRLQIARLQAEIQHLQQRYQIDMHDKDRLNQNREKNLAQYLSEEQKRIMDLWAELQQVRRQFADYKDQTARELKAQREEFARMSQNVGGVVRKLSITSIGENGHDAEIVEAIKRFKQIQTISTGASVDDYNALMKKYEEAIERIVELETLGSERVGKDTTLDVELKRTKERLTECQEVLRKLHYLAKEHVSKVKIEKRARSLSPGGNVVPLEVLRTVRNVMRMHSTEVQQLERKFKNTQLEMSDLAVRFEASEETRKRVEKQLLDAKAEISIHEKAVENANREVRRLEDRLRASEAERSVAEAARVKLDEEIHRLKLIIDQTITDGERKALEQIEAQKRIIEEEYKTHTAELMRRIDTLQDDNRRLKGDLNTIKEKYRNLEIEYNTTLRKIDEKDLVIKRLEEIKGDLLKDLEKQRARFDALTNEYDQIKANYDSSTKRITAMEMTIKELKHERDEMSKQKEDLARQLADIAHKMELETKKREDIEKANIRHLNEIEKLKVQITEYEAEVAMLRRHNDELDTQLKMTQAKIVTLENSLTSAQKEIVSLNELNAKLQKEKNEIMNLKQRADHDIDVLKERLRKLEQEIDKLHAENKALHDSEEKANIAYKEESNKVHLLQRELQEAKAEIDELKKRLAQMDEANKERLELALRTKTPDFGVYDTTYITEARVKELGDKHRLDTERLENERDELARRLRLLEDELAEKQRTIDRQHAEIDEQKRRYEAEIERLKTELANLETKYQNELEDERDRHSHEIEALKAAEDDLRNKITHLEKKLQEALNREKLLQKEIAEWEEKYDTLNKEVHKLRDEIETIHLNAEKEIQKWKTEAFTAQTELKNLEAVNETLRAQLAAANERANSLNRTINEQAAKIKDLNSHIRHLEEQLMEVKATAAAFEADLQSTQSRLEAIEQKYANVQLENNKLRGEIDSLNRQIDVLKGTNAANESEIERLKKKLVQLTAINNEQVDELNRLTTNKLTNSTESELSVIK